CEAAQVLVTEPLQVVLGELALCTEEPVIDREWAHSREQLAQASRVVARDAADDDRRAIAEHGLLLIRHDSSVTPRCSEHRPVQEASQRVARSLAAKCATLAPGSPQDATAALGRQNDAAM